MKIGIIGAGNMGEAIIKSLWENADNQLFVNEKDVLRLERIDKNYRIEKSTIEQLVKECNIIVICVKPQDIDELLNFLRDGITNKHLVLSIIAGVTTSHIEEFFKKDVPVIRVMPNMPGIIGRGISAYCLGKKAQDVHAKIAEDIFSGLGKTIRTTEDKMNAITAVSGSGPGFIAYLIDGLKEAALKIGLNDKEAELFSLEVTSGTSYLLLNEKIKPMELVERVASKGGTTEAGLNVFKKKEINIIIAQAVKAALKRAGELSKR